MRKKLRRLHSRLVVSHRRQTRRLRLISRHPFVVPVIAFAVLAGLSVAALWLTLSRGNSLTPAATDIVIISYDHQSRTVPSHEPTVGALLTKLRIPINKGDVVEPAADTPINQDDFRINIYRAVPVKVTDGPNTTFAYNAATTPRSVAAQAGITVYPEDALSEAPVNNILQEGTIGKVVTIDRSAPVVLSLNGLPTTTRTRAKTVGAFLTEKHIKLAKHDSVQPSANTPIIPNQTIAVVRDGTGIQNTTEAISMPVQYINDDSLAYGTFATRQQGSPGQQVLTYRITVKSGQIVDRTLLQTVVTTEPVTQIIARGTNLSGIKGDMARAGISPDDYQYADYIISRESGWCPTKAQGQYGSCPAYPGYVPATGGYGLCQATPGSKMSVAGADWATNPITQLRWCTSYASRYGGWQGSYDFWAAHHYW